MNFVSWAFATLFLVVFAARLTVGRRKIETPYVTVLLVASLVFYGWHVPSYVALLVGSALVDFLAARAMGEAGPDRQSVRRALLVASLVSNLGVLAFFKYGGFAAQAAEDLAALAGASLRVPAVQLVLPMGISFYTFQTLSYTIDVYRGELAPGTELLALPPVHQLLPAARGRAHRACERVPAPDAAPTPAPSAGLLRRRVAGDCRPLLEDGVRRQPCGLRG